MERSCHGSHWGSPWASSSPWVVVWTSLLWCIIVYHHLVQWFSNSQGVWTMPEVCHITPWPQGSCRNWGAHELPWIHPGLQQPLRSVRSPVSASTQPWSCEGSVCYDHDPLSVCSHGLYLQKWVMIVTFTFLAVLGTLRRLMLGFPTQGSPSKVVILEITSLPFPSSPLRESEHRVLWLRCHETTVWEPHPSDW